MRPQRAASGVRRAYLLVEHLACGRQIRDVFCADSDREALSRIHDVVDSVKAELWRGGEVVWAGPGVAAAVAAAVLPGERGTSPAFAA